MTPLPNLLPGVSAAYCEPLQAVKRKSRMAMDSGLTSSQTGKDI